MNPVQFIFNLKTKDLVIYIVSFKNFVTYFNHLPFAFDTEYNHSVQQIFLHFPPFCGVRVVELVVFLVETVLGHIYRLLLHSPRGTFVLCPQNRQILFGSSNEARLLEAIFFMNQFKLGKHFH